MGEIGLEKPGGALGLSDEFLAVLNSLLQLSRPLPLVLVPIRGLRRNQHRGFRPCYLNTMAGKGRRLIKRFTWLLAVSSILGGAAYAQDHPKVEVTGYYSYFRFNPENSGTLSSHSLNGGGGEVSLYFSRMIGIKAEFAGY